MSLNVDIRKTLGSFHLDVSFRTEGDVLGLLGASGCGKSMTLKCIAGIERPDEGRIELNGRVLFDSEARIDLPPQRRRVGYLFQQYALFPTMTAEQNIAAGARRLAKADRAAAVNAMMEKMQIAGLGGKFPAQLSGGQQQRVALARILISDPEVMLLDEPFSALDAHLRDRMEQEVMELLRDFGRDALIVSHSRDELYRMTDGSTPSARSTPSSGIPAPTPPPSSPDARISAGSRASGTSPAAPSFTPTTGAWSCPCPGGSRARSWACAATTPCWRSFPAPTPLRWSGSP